MTKNEMKNHMDKYIKTTTTVKGKNKGERRQAWADVKALELLVQAAKG